MTDDLVTEFMRAFDGSTARVNLSEAEAVEGIVPVEHGGTGNDRAIVAGLGEYVQPHLGRFAGLTTLPYGTLLAVGPSDGLVVPTTVASQAVVGVVADPTIDDLKPGLMQTDGLAYVLVASAVAKGDRVQASATRGKCETSTFGLSAFGTARTASDGTGVWVFLTVGDEAITGSSFTHRTLRDVPGILRHIDLVEGTAVTAFGTFLGSGQQIDPLTSQDHDATSTSGLLFNDSGTRWVRIDVGSFGAYNGIKAAGFRVRLVSIGGYHSPTVTLKGNTVDNIATATTIATMGVSITGGTGTINEVLAAASAAYRYFWLDLSSIDDRFILTEWSVFEAVGAVVAVNDPVAGGGGYLNTVLAGLAAAIVATRWEPMTNGDVSSPEIVFADGDVVMVLVPA